MAVYQIADDADFAGQIGNMTQSGNTMEFLDGGTVTDVIIPSNVAVGSDFVAETAKVSQISSLVVQKGGIAIDGLYVQLDHDAIAAAVTDGQLVSIDVADTAGLELTNLRIRGGMWNGTGHDDFEYRAGYAEAAYASIIGDLANGIYSGTIGAGNGDDEDSVNGMTYVPGGITSTGVHSGDLLIKGCDIEDLKGGAALRPALNAGQNVTIRANNWRRCYVDVIALAWPTGSFAGADRIEITGNLLENCGWALAQDNANAHADLISMLGKSGTVSPVPGVFIVGNAMVYLPGFRGLPARIFASDHNSGYPLYAPVIGDNLMLARRSNKGIWTSADTPLTGAIHAYWLRNAPLTIPTQNGLLAGNGNYDHPSTLVEADVGSPSAARVNAQWDNIFPVGKNLIGLNLAEQIDGGAHIDSTTYPNLTFGAALGSSAYAAGIDTPAGGWDALATIEDVFAAFEAKTAHDEKGPIRPGDTLASFLARWSTDTKPYDDLPSYIGVGTKVRQPASTAVESDWGYVHAGFGTRTLTPGAGLQWQEADDVAGTGATSYSGSAGTVTHGKFVRFKGTSGATPGTAVTFSYTLGDQTLSWQVGTESNVAWPLATFNGDAIVRQSTGTGWGVADAKQLTLMVAFQIDTLSADRTFVGSNPASQGRLTMSAQNATKDVRFTMGNDTPTNIVQFDIPMTVDDGNLHTILLTIDTAQASTGTGVVCYVDDVLTVVTQLIWTIDGLFNFNATNNPQVGGTASTPAYSGDFGAFWLEPAVALDLTDSDVRGGFDPAYIGPVGEAPTGSTPRNFLVGVAATWDAGDPNVGTGPSWAKVGGGGTISAGNAEVWPPILQLYATVLTAGPYLVGEPITIRVSAAGYPKGSMDVVAAVNFGTIDDSTQDLPNGSTGIDFVVTPDQAGTLEFDTTNTGSYLNVPTLELEIVTAGGGPPTRRRRRGLGLGLRLR